MGQSIERKKALMRVHLAIEAIKKSLPELQDHIQAGLAKSGDSTILEFIVYGDLAWGATAVSRAEILIIDRGYYSEGGVRWMDLEEACAKYFSISQTLLRYLRGGEFEFELELLFLPVCVLQPGDYRRIFCEAHWGNPTLIPEAFSRLLRHRSGEDQLATTFTPVTPEWLEQEYRAEVQNYNPSL